jgi:hypothetical protein
MSKEIDNLNPALPPGLRRVAMPVVDATPATLEGFGWLVQDPSECPIEIVQWPAVGTRLIDPGTGDEAGTTEGTFVSEWREDILYGRNNAVGGRYILAYATAPEAARDDNANAPDRMLLWHANYHPDGGQLFFPLDPLPFYVPLALPGDDIVPEKFVCFRFDGQRASISNRTTGMEAYSRLRRRSGSSTSRAPFMRASLSTLPASLAVFLKYQSRAQPDRLVKPANCSNPSGLWHSARRSDSCCGAVERNGSMLPDQKTPTPAR